MNAFLPLLLIAPTLAAAATPGPRTASAATPYGHVTVTVEGPAPNRIRVGVQDLPADPACRVAGFRGIVAARDGGKNALLFVPVESGSTAVREFVSSRAVRLPDVEVSVHLVFGAARCALKPDYVNLTLPPREP